MTKHFSKAKIVEYLIYLYLIFIITYDTILPKSMANKIYEFGPLKLTIIILSLFVFLFFYFAKNQKEFLKEKFSYKRIIVSSIVSILILLLYFFSR